MIRKLLLKIGTKTVKSYTIITSPNNYKKIKNIQIRNKKQQHKKITYSESIDEILKENTKKAPTSKEQIKIALFLITSLTIISLIFNILTALIINLLILSMIIIIKLKPTITQKNRTNEILKVLPYALRQMATELKAGLGLYDSMNSVANSDYGVLSEEFKRTLEDIHYGDNYKTALNNLSKRINNELMDQITNQIIRTLTNGGDLSNTLNAIAEESAYEMRIKYKEYSEKLNSFMMLYMFIAVLGPVVFFIMIIAATTIMGSIIPPELLLILYLFFFPLIISVIILFIKQLEPKLN